MEFNSEGCVTTAMPVTSSCLLTAMTSEHPLLAVVSFARYSEAVSNDSHLKKF